VLSDNELRTLAAVVRGEAPSEEFLQELRACLLSEQGEQEAGVVAVTSPHITLDRVVGCDLATDGLSKHARFPTTHEEQSLQEVAFEMITDDYNQTLAQLDSIRSRKSKFVCVNDDMRHPSPELVQALEDFYESFFPLPSQFELPRGSHNAELYIQPLRAHLARRSAGRLAAWVILLGAVAALVTTWVVRVAKRHAHEY